MLDVILDNSVKCRDAVSLSSTSRAPYDTLDKGEFAEVLALIEIAETRALGGVLACSRDALKGLDYLDRKCIDSAAAIKHLYDSGFPRARLFNRATSELSDMLYELYGGVNDVLDTIDNIATELNKLIVKVADTIIELHDIHATLVRLEQNA